jgi:tRNA (guanosine-2'-O-)-methyltransferase
MTPARERRIRETLSRRQPDLTVVMDRVHKPHNLAAIARTCDAVGVFELHAVPLPDGAARLRRDKAAGGAGKWLPLRKHADIHAAYEQLRRRGMRLYAAHGSPEAVDFRSIDYTLPTAIVVGAELDGISDAAVAAADGTVSVPMLGMTRSLNVSVATAVILYEAQRQREVAGFYAARRLADELFEEYLRLWSEN